MRRSDKFAAFAIEALDAASDGFEILLATRRHQRILAHEGLAGIRRIVRENRERELRAWIRSARRSRLVTARKIGDRLRVRLSDKGEIHLLKLRIRRARPLPRGEAIIVAFDMPVSQKPARESFRHFLKSCGFVRLQQSVWSTSRDVAAPLRTFIERNGLDDWVRVFRAVA